MRSERYTGGGLAYRPTGEPVQDYGYDYDLAGNILTIRDRTPDSGILNNPDALTATDPAVGRLLIGGNALDRRCTYDPTYRLVTATGRECDVPSNEPPWADQPRGTDITRARAYTESYRYDSLGNLLRLVHGGEPGGFTRRFTVDPASNRLQRLRVGPDRYDYTFDAGGNLTSETSARHFDWNHADKMVAFRTQTGTVEPSVPPPDTQPAIAPGIPRICEMYCPGSDDCAVAISPEKSVDCDDGTNAHSNTHPNCRTRFQSQPHPVPPSL